MVKDILIDIKEHDIILTDKASKNEPIFESEWRNNILVVKVPLMYSSNLSYDADGHFSCKVNIPYKPLNNTFMITVSVISGLNLEPVSSIGINNAYAYVNGSTKTTQIKACQLPMIDIDGVFRVVFTSEKSIAYIYSAKQLDLTIGASDNQSAQLLAICAPGKNYRYPTTGIDITKYLNGVVMHSDLQYAIEKQYNADGKSVHSAEFDSITGSLNTVFNAENVQDDNSNLVPVEKLGINALSLFNDENIASLLNIDRRHVFGFQSIFNMRSDILSLFYFIPNNDNVLRNEMTRMDDSKTLAILNADGTTTQDNTHYVISSEAKAGDIVMFKMPNVQNNDRSVFFMDSLNVTEEYDALCDCQSISNVDVYKCALITRDCLIMYSLSKSAYNSDDGLYILHETGHNVSMLMAIVNNRVSDRNKGIISESMTIDDKILNSIIETFNE